MNNICNIKLLRILECYILQIMSYLFISPNNFIINEIHNKTPDIYTEYKSIMNKYEYEYLN